MSWHSHLHSSLYQLNQISYNTQIILRVHLGSFACFPFVFIDKQFYSIYSSPHSSQISPPLYLFVPATLCLFFLSPISQSCKLCDSDQLMCGSPLTSVSSHYQPGEFEVIVSLEFSIISVLLQSFHIYIIINI